MAKVKPEDYQFFLDERDKHVVKIKDGIGSEDPTYKDHRTAKKGHLNIAVLDAWEDDLLTDEDIRDYMSEFEKCEYCTGVYRFYLDTRTNKDQ